MMVVIVLFRIGPKISGFFNLISMISTNQTLVLQLQVEIPLLSAPSNEW